MHRPFPDLRAFLADLRGASDLAVVEAEVDPELELPEIHRRVIAAGGPALSFSNVRGSEWSLATNLFGTHARVERAFGDRPRELIAEIASAPEQLVPPSLGKLWRKRGLLTSLARVGTSRSGRAPVTDVVEREPRLSQVPMTKSWARDGGAFLTLPLVYTEHPDTGGSNLGIYRMQRYDDASTGLHMQIGKGGGFHLAAAEAAGRDLPVNVFLGGPPALLLSALAPLPENVPEILLASLLLGRRLPTARNPVGPLPLAADAELVLVGHARAGERRPEGPFGDHYGYYSETHDYPVFRCDAIVRRADPIVPATVVGKPRQEDFYLGDFVQELLAPLFPLAMPGVRDLWSYGETGYHSLAAAVVHERYKREAMASAFRILGEGQLSLTKFLLVVDQAIELRDFPAVLEHVLARADFRTDLFLLPNLSMDSLDYAGPRIDEGSKGVLLGLGEPRRELPRELSGAPLSGVRAARPFCAGCVVVELSDHDEDPRAAARVAADPAFAGWPLIVLVDEVASATRNTARFLWTTFTRFDPARDITAAATELVHNHAALTPPLVLDARMKTGYPGELFCDEETAERVSRRWDEYFPDGGVEMGDSDRAHLG